MKSCRPYKYVFILLCSIGTASAVAQSDIRFVNEFLNIGVGARAQGMFGSVAASTDDVTAAYWNPSGLAHIDKPSQLSAMHASWFGGIANYDYIGFGKTFNSRNNSFGSISIIRMGVDNIPNTLNLIGPDGTVDYDRVTNFSASDYAVFLSYGQKLGEKWAVGGSVKLIYRSIGSFGNAIGFGADLGLMYKSGPLSLAVMGRDITTTVNNWSFSLTPEEAIAFEQTGNVVPVSSTEVALPKLVFAGAWTISPGNDFSCLLEADLRLSSDGTEAGVFSGEHIGIDPTFGIEAAYIEKIYVRAGIGNIQRSINETSSTESSLEFTPNVGLGLKLGRLHIDYALTNIGSVSGVQPSHIFSASLYFDER